MSWLIPKIWEDEDVWIIGGGPSITKQFKIPSRIVQDVISETSPPSVYSPYLKKLHDKHVIGVNVAYLLGDWIDIVFFGDSGFFLKYKNQLAVFPGLKVSCNPQTANYKWVKTVDRDTRFPKGITPNMYKVSWNHNSGAAAISLAAHSGAKRIFLLGFDMKLGNGNAQHWHDKYHKREGKELPFARHLMGFPIIAKDAKKMGIEIINVNPDSAIDCFPKVNLDDVL